MGVYYQIPVIKYYIYQNIMTSLVIAIVVNIQIRGQGERTTTKHSLQSHYHLPQRCLRKRSLSRGLIYGGKKPKDKPNPVNTCSMTFGRGCTRSLRGARGTPLLSDLLQNLSKSYRTWSSQLKS